MSGVRVLELAQIMAGPICGSMLADLGADVIKVEKISGGDDARRFGENKKNMLPAPFTMVNRNKRGIAIDLKHPDSRALLHDMVKQSDVVIENYRLGAMEKLSLGFDELIGINPGLIYCSLSGYGRTGPMASQGGFDLVAQGYTGLMSVTGEVGGDPVKPGNSVGDINAGILGAMAVMAAYIHRLKTGEGQFVESSLYEASLQQMYWFAAMYFGTGKIPGPNGSAHPLAAPYQAFRAADKWITIGGANQSNWESIATVLGHPEWITDPRFLTNDKRKEHEPALVKIIGDVLKERESAYWIAQLEAAGVPAGPINNIAEAVDHPQTRAREMVIELEHPVAGHARAFGFPIKFSRTPAAITRPAPLLGEHSREILLEFGYSEERVRRLIEDKVVGVGGAA